MFTGVYVQDTIQKVRMLLQVLHESSGLLLCQVASTDGLIHCVLDCIRHNCVQLRG